MPANALGGVVVTFRRHTVGLAGSTCQFVSPEDSCPPPSAAVLRLPLHGEGAVNDRLLTRVLYGISCRNYAAIRRRRTGLAVGVEPSPFIQASPRLHEFHERDPPILAFIALGITMTGEKRFLGFVGDTENAQVLTPFSACSTSRACGDPNR